MAKEYSDSPGEHGADERAVEPSARERPREDSPPAPLDAGHGRLRRHARRILESPGHIGRLSRRLTKRAVPVPDQRNVAYGPHGRQKLDLWQARSAVPTPCVLALHGGGWTAGDKERIARLINVADLLAAGVSVASANYRFVHMAHDVDQPPLSLPMRDAARALQYIRSRAAEWNIDGQRIGVVGGSAGGCSALWLAFHPDLADHANADPVLRECSIPACVAAVVAQTTLDPAEMLAWTPNSNYGGHAFGFENFDTFYRLRETVRDWIDEYSPMANVRQNGTSVYLRYHDVPAPHRNAVDPAHTANFGVMFQEKCRETGVSCELVYPGAPDVVHRSPTEFLLALPRPPAP